MRQLALLAVLLLLPATALGATIVAPNGYETSEGNEGNSFPFNNFTGRYQQAYAASQFAASPISISEIAFRTDANPAAANWFSAMDFTVRLSTSANPVGSLSITFADNVGSNDALVFTTPALATYGGTNAGGTGPNAFDLILSLDDDFEYDPSQGDLLIDVFLDSQTNFLPPAGFSYLDAVESTTGLFDVGVQRVWNSGGDPSALTGSTDLHGFGLVTRFTYTVVPEPGTGLLVAVGLFGLALRRRRTAALAIAVLGLPAATASAEPIDQWNDIGPGYDCTSDPYNPIRADGTRDPHGDPLPGEPEWSLRDEEHVACADARDHDSRPNPFRNVGTAQYGHDPYREPDRHQNLRFRYQSFTQLDIPSVPSTEIYRPCPTDPSVCPNLPAGLPRFDPPYPVVLVFHGFIAQKEHHRFNSQVFAENGYMAIAVNGTSPGVPGPNSQRAQNGDDVLRWLAGQSTNALGMPIDPGVYGDEADLDRVAFTGHSQGAGVSLGYQGDPRVHAIIAWDGGDDIAAANCTTGPCTPIMYQRTDGGFATPSARTDYPADRTRGLPTYLSHKQRGMNVFHFTNRATVHTDWNGYGVGLAGNRYAELVINYHNLAWLDRHLRGKLAFTATGAVKTYAGRSAAQERVFRQAIANDAFDRLTARTFDDSADRHNVSMGFWDPDQALASPTDPYAGNVPVTVEGLEIRDRYSPYFYGYCRVTVPNYVGGGNGRPNDAVPPLRVADTGAEGDLRFEGCPEL